MRKVLVISVLLLFACGNDKPGGTKPAPSSSGTTFQQQVEAVSDCNVLDGLAATEIRKMAGGGAPVGGRVANLAQDHLVRIYMRQVELHCRTTLTAPPTPPSS
jgi:hypothetical protein